MTGLCMTDGPLHDRRDVHQKICASATLYTLNRHLNIVTIPNPTQPPEPRPAFACRKGILIPPQIRRAGRTVPHILSRKPVEDFVGDPDEEPAPQQPSTQPCPTLAATAYPSNAWVPLCNSSYLLASSAAKASPAGSVPTLLGRQPMQTSTNPRDLPRIPRISRTIFVGRKFRAVPRSYGLGAARVRELLRAAIRGNFGDD